MKYYLYRQDNYTVHSIDRRPLGDSKLNYSKMERNLRRYKNKKYPKKPKSVTEIMEAYKNPEILHQFGNNLRNTAQFYIDTVQIEPNSVFTVFASHQVLDLVKRHISFDEQYIMMDGTFDVTPIGYYQLFIIYIQFKNDVSFSFLIKKSQKYRAISINYYHDSGVSNILCPNVWQNCEVI